MARRGLVMTMADVRAHAARHGFTMEVSTEDVSKDSAAIKAVVTFPVVKPKMNKTEGAYAAILEARKQRGEIVEWAFEPFSLIYGDNVRYKPDFVVRNSSSEITIRELTKLCVNPAIEALQRHNIFWCLERMKKAADLGTIKWFDIIEVKGGYLYPEAKPRFNAAKLRHEWANFFMIQKQASGWVHIL